MRPDFQSSFCFKLQKVLKTSIIVGNVYINKHGNIRKVYADLTLPRTPEPCAPVGHVFFIKFRKTGTFMSVNNITITVFEASMISL